MEAKDLSRMLIEARDKKGLTPEELCEKIRIQPSVLNDIETGVFTGLAPLYMKGFLRKYALAVGLDEGRVVRDYERVTGGERTKKQEEPLSPPKAPKKPAERAKPSVITEEPVKGSRRLDEIPVEPLRVPSAAPMEGLQAPQFKAAKKYLQLILVAALTVLAVALVFVLGKMVKNWTPSRSRAALASGEKGFSSGKAAGEDREIIEPGMISLKLRANGKVWVQVKKGDKNLYAGVMDKGDSGAWRSDVPLTVWTGKGENLVFVLNNRDLGVVAEGVVKNIKVSAEGIKIGAKTIPLKE